MRLAATGDARRLLLAALVLQHRLLPRDPLIEATPAFELQCARLLLDEAPVDLDTVERTLAIVTF